MIEQKNTTQITHTSVRVITISILIWIFILSVLTIFNSCAIIKKDKVDNNNTPPLVVLEYLEVD